MRKLFEIQPKFIKEYSEKLDHGILYIVDGKLLGKPGEWTSSNHLCPCGCGEKVYIPFDQRNWSLQINNDKVTINPSLANTFSCRSHYFIRDNKIIWV